MEFAELNIKEYNYTNTNSLYGRLKNLFIKQEEITIDFEPTIILLDEIIKLRKNDPNEESNSVLNLVIEYIIEFLKSVDFYTERLCLVEENFYKENNDKIDIFLKEFSKIFFILEKYYGLFIYNERIAIAQEKRQEIIKKIETGIGDELSHIFKHLNWLHDGWLNNYYIDSNEFTKQILKYTETIRKKDLKKDLNNNFEVNGKYYLMSMFRKLEDGKKKEAIKIAKKYHRKFNLILFKVMMNKKIISLSKFEILMNIRVLIFSRYLKYKVNLLTFLYNQTHKKKYLKENLRLINLKKNMKLYKKSTALCENFFVEGTPFKPQQMIKNIEVMLQDYSLKPTNSKKILLQHHILRLLRYFPDYYNKPDEVVLNYFILFEIIFLITTYSEKVLNIN